MEIRVPCRNSTVSIHHRGLHPNAVCCCIRTDPYPASTILSVSFPCCSASASVEHIVPLVYYNNSYPTSLLVDGSNGPWYVTTTVFFAAPAAVDGTLTVTGSWPGAGAPVVISTSLPAGNSSFSATLPASDVLLWWPNGLGAQQLYPVSVSWTPAPATSSSVAAPPVTDSRNIGFRSLYLVTANDANPGELVGSEGSGNFTM